jgi:SAM-dependent methyltransferase
LPIRVVAATVERMSTTSDAAREREQWWEAFYAEGRARWSGKPNGTLVEEVAGLRPGRALDLGCGQGADAIWLAQQGWTVTAVDIAQTALDTAMRNADAAGVPSRPARGEDSGAASGAQAGAASGTQAGVASGGQTGAASDAQAGAARDADAAVGTIAWERHDLAVSLPAGRFDLVAATFLHSPVDIPRERILRDVAELIEPGGTLLVIGHVASPAHQHPELRDPEQVAAELALPAERWALRACESREVEHRFRDEEPIRRVDGVVRYERLPD